MSKINLGLPLYGQSYELTTNKHEFGAPSTAPGREGDYTRQSGMLAYYEICKKGMYVCIVRANYANLLCCLEP